MRRSARASLVAALCLGLFQIITTLTINAQEATAAATHRVFIPYVMSSAVAPQLSWANEALVALSEINRLRQAVGCPALQPSNELRLAAERHSEDMASSGSLSHTGSNGTDFVQRAKAANYAYTPSGETIAAGYTTSSAVITGWMNSPGHRDILTNCANNDIGVGVHVNPNSTYRYYWTAVLGRR